MQTAHVEAWIKERAYAIWEQEGRPAGREWEHWFRAAGELNSVAAAEPIEAEAAPVKASPKRKPATAKSKSKKTA